MEDLSPPIPNAAVENDAMDGDVFVLFGYTCDLPRLRNFDSALQINSRKGCVICFDFQRAAYRRCLHPDIRLVSIDLAACERRVISSPENKSSCSR